MPTTTQKLRISTSWSNGAKYQDGFGVVDCSECSIVFALTDSFIQRCTSSGKTFYCPNGHAQAWKETDAAKLRKAKEEAARTEARLRRQIDNALDNAQFERRRAAALKGHLTRARNRAAAGVCPQPGCRRSFHSLAEHVRTEHPNLIETLSDA